MENEFRVRKSSSGYRVEFWRDGEPYVTFLDGLSRQSAEREARSLTALWVKIAVPHSAGASAPAVQRSANINICHTDSKPAVVAGLQMTGELKKV